MFGYQLVKTFLSPGYEVWEDWSDNYLNTGMKLGWTEEETMNWLPTKLNAVTYLPRSYWLSTPGKQACTLTENLNQFEIQWSDNPILLSKATICLLEGKREVGRNSLKLVILWIRERDSSVLKGA